MIPPYFALLLVACGGTVDKNSSGSSGAPGSSSLPPGSSAAAGGDTTSMSDAIVGQLIVTTEATDTGPTGYFTADLQPRPAPTSSGACPGATAVAGACCVFPPIPRVPTLPPPTSGSGPTSVNYGTSAGPLALLDATSNAPIGSFDFGPRGYAGLPAYYSSARWQPGDILSVSAAGDAIAAFAVSAPALVPPVVHVPAYVAGEDVTLTWQPDPNGETMTIQIQDESAGSVIIGCTAPDADGTLTVKASLFAAFKSGDACETSGVRETVRYAQTKAGRVALRSSGYGQTVSTSVK